MKSIATIKLKIPKSKVILDTMRQYSKAVSHIADKGYFVCSHCGYSLNSDLNASYNLAKHYSTTDSVSVAVTQPHIQADELEGSLRTTESEAMDKSPRL